MKTNNKVIIYDDNCPLCAAYTSAFVHTGLLEKDGRKNFSDIDADIFRYIDKTRCHTEIPLIDTDTKQVWYGIDAMLEVISIKSAFIKKIGNISFVKWFLLKLYKFISYNRKVIVAVSTEKGKYDCSPELNVRYRSAFLMVVFLFCSLMLFPYQTYIFSNSFFATKTVAEIQTYYCLFSSLNIFAVVRLKKNETFEYLGQLSMLTLTVISLMLPLYIFIRITGFTSFSVNNIYLVLTTFCLAREYYRRMKYAHIFYEHRIIVIINLIAALALVTCFLW